MRKIGRMRRAVSALLAVALSTTLVPATAFADEQTDAQTQQELPLASEQGDITVRDMGENGEQKQVYGLHPAMLLGLDDGGTGTGETTGADNLNLTVPINVTFGDGNGYDVSADPPQTVVTSSGKFVNNGDDVVRLKYLKCTEDGALNVLNNSEGKKIFGITAHSTSGDREVRFGLSDDCNEVFGESTGSFFDVYPGKSLSLTYKLYLEDGTSVKESAAEGNGTEIKPLARIVYEFEKPASGTGQTTDDFYFLNKGNGKIYSLEEVVTAANDIASLGDKSTFYKEYRNLVVEDSKNFSTDGWTPDKSPYECKVIYRDKMRFLRLVDVGRIENGKRTGLTFHFLNCLDNGGYQMNASTNRDLTWDATTLRSSLQPGGEIYEEIYQGIRENVVPVTKNYSIYNNDDYSKTKKTGSIEDYFWIPSYSEIWGDSETGPCTDKNSSKWYEEYCGAQFLFYESVGLTTSYHGDIPEMQCTKRFLGDPTYPVNYSYSSGTGVYNWARNKTCSSSENWSVFDNDRGLYNTMADMTWGKSTENEYRRVGVLPCFCLGRNVSGS